jgi:hypothetical protein
LRVTAKKLNEHFIFDKEMSNFEPFGFSKFKNYLDLNAIATLFASFLGVALFIISPSKKEPNKPGQLNNN